MLLAPWPDKILQYEKFAAKVAESGELLFRGPRWAGSLPCIFVAAWVWWCARACEWVWCACVYKCVCMQEREHIGLIVWCPSC